MFGHVWVWVGFGYFGGLDLLLVICGSGAVFVSVTCWPPGCCVCDCFCCCVGCLL